jgi:hypothetical protein
VCISQVQTNVFTGEEKILIEPSQFRNLIIQVLQELELEIPFSTDAVELLMLTAAHESHLGSFIRQMHGGPARGVFQMEPATEQDIHENYLKYNKNLAHLIEGFRMKQTNISDLESNLAYQIAMTRVHYFRVKEALPTIEKDGVVGLASYWKKHYNTYQGAGTVAKALADYEKYAG